ncbi:hypothetical protein [Hyphomonas sp.]|uniref:hypothetical protein n=1 Tax=Hyphomonas sp. TaxID=87 RepID=UPI0025BB4DFD|nr:hypothetical protein [Hyphomonas sp.]MBI1399608.1 hypothetical protein [Hyphomonas sp.]
MRALLIQNLERRLPQLLSVAQFLVGQERGSEEILEDWLSKVLERTSAADFVSLSEAHLFASCCAFFLMSEISLEISDMDQRLEIAIAEVAAITRERETYIRQILLPAAQSLKE